jgi:hypothetical protein
MAEQVLVHVGTHRTGTTSLQIFLHDHNGSLLADAGAFVPPGLVMPSLHAELPLLSLREELAWPARIRFPETRTPSWLAAAEDHVRDQVRSSTHRLLVYSHEDLSYLRHDDEATRLRDLFAGLPVKIVVFLRDKHAFLASYRAQLEAMGFTPADDPASFAYVGPDSWLLDYGALVDAYQRTFGAAAVEVLDYDRIVERDGSVIPAFTDLLGIARRSLPPLDRYFVNRAGAHVRPTDEQLAAIRRRLAERS